MYNQNIVQEDINFINSLECLNLSEFQNSNFLITGANGMIASFLINFFASITSCNVFGNVRDVNKFNNIYSNKRENIVPLYVSTENLSYNMFNNTNLDYIIHASSLAAPQNFTADPIDVFTSNIVGMLKILEIANKMNVKNIIFISSAEVYGDIDNDQPINEDSYCKVNHLSLRSCYSEAKRSAEALLSSYASINNQKITIIRPFHTFGPVLNINDNRIFSYLCKSVIEKTNIELSSSYNDIRSFCYIVDFTTALITILTKEGISSVYNIGNPYNTFSMLEIANIVSCLFESNKVSVTIPQDVQKLRKIIIPDIKKLENLGWKPLFDAKNGFRRTIQYHLK